jgi:hypothetical protein
MQSVLATNHGSSRRAWAQIVQLFQSDFRLDLTAGTKLRQAPSARDSV